ncbi:DUF1801 domain-containing protein [Companilactobacillus sp.]|uniref:iron chaperone n=1 Tax=Companilactobacillus sp. TaxID=2767905 RepID=UPI00260EED6A|nr:DUF1801 domain-containing protein [Companilactobacillus sp.]
MAVFDEYLNTLDDGDHKLRMIEILDKIHQEFPELGRKVAWNQPMFTDHGTFIIAFSMAKNHISVAPEQAGIEHFKELFDHVGYSYTKQLFRIGFDQEVDYSVLKNVIEFNIKDKTDNQKFWR